MGPLFVSYYYWFMGPVFRLAARSRLKPNHVTLLTLVVAVPSAVAIATGHFALGSALVIVGGSLDIIDGHLARTNKMATPGGAFLDSTVDRICDGLIFSGCVVYYAGTPIMFVALAVLVMSFTVSYARSRAEVLGVTGSEGLMQRAERLAVLGSALAFSSYFGHRSEGFVAHPFYAITACSLCLLAVLNTVTACRRIVWTLRQFRRDPVVLPQRSRRPTIRPSDASGQRQRPDARQARSVNHLSGTGRQRRGLVPRRVALRLLVVSGAVLFLVRGLAWGQVAEAVRGANLALLAARRRR